MGSLEWAVQGKLFGLLFVEMNEWQRAEDRGRRHVGRLVGQSAAERGDKICRVEL